MRESIHTLLLTGLLALAACGGSSSYSPDAAGAKALATALNGNVAALAELKPTLDDCKAIATDDAFAQKLFDYATKLYASLGSDGIKGKPEQTEVTVTSATTAALKAGKGGDLPGGYGQIASKLKDGLTIWVIRYVTPGDKSGMRYDGFMHVNGRWVFIPKPWRALS